MQTLAKPSGLAFVDRTFNVVFGAVSGLALAGIALIIFSGTTIPPLLSDGIFSGLTFAGIGLAVYGYYVNTKSRSTTLTDFLLGFGIGLILVAFLGAGNGTLSLQQ